MIYYDSEKWKYYEMLKKDRFEIQLKWYRENFAQDLALVFYQECTVG